MIHDGSDFTNGDRGLLPCTLTVEETQADVTAQLEEVLVTIGGTQ